MLRNNSINTTLHFTLSDQKFGLRILQNFLLLIGFYTLVADMVPILGILSTAFLLLSAVYSVFYLYKRRRWGARFGHQNKGIVFLSILFSTVFFLIFLTSKVDYLIVLATPLNLIQSVPAISFEDKIGYLTAFFILQIIPLLIFLAILTPRQKVVWKLDSVNQLLHLTFYHPLYNETRLIPLTDVVRLEFGSYAPLVRVFTNTLRMTITYKDSTRRTFEIATANTPFLLLMDSLISLMQLCDEDRVVSLKWFREVGDYLQNAVFTKNLITEEISLPLNHSVRFKLCRSNIKNSGQELRNRDNIEILSRRRGAFYRRKLSDCFVFIMGVSCLAVALLLGSIVPKLTFMSVMMSEFDLPHGFNGEILLFFALFVIILAFGARLTYISWLRLFGYTRLYWAKDGLFIGTKWNNLNHVEYFIPYTLIWDMYLSLGSSISGKSDVWLQTPFLTLLVWIGVSSDVTTQTIIALTVQKAKDKCRTVTS